MAHAHPPQYPLLDTRYDETHRGKMLEERREVLKPLRPRVHKPLAWDEKYAPYMRRAGLLPLVRMIQGGLPMMDRAALTALVD